MDSNKIVIKGISYIKANVHMLPAKKQEYQVERGKLFINDSRAFSWGKLEALECERLTVNGHAWNGTGIQTYINHLYFTSNEKPKVGDWSINLNSPYKHMELCKIDNDTELERYVNKDGNDCRKIIATTDKSLNQYGIMCADKSVARPCINIPQPPQPFLKEYVNAGGIDKVFIEVDKNWIIKTDSNNFITIHTINIEEVDDSTKVYVRENGTMYFKLSDYIKSDSFKRLSEQFKSSKVFKEIQTQIDDNNESDKHIDLDYYNNLVNSYHMVLEHQTKLLEKSIETTHQLHGIVDNLKQQLEDLYN